MSVEANGKL
jgi:hypothetical protein